MEARNEHELIHKSFVTNVQLHMFFTLSTSRCELAMCSAMCSQSSKAILDLISETTQSKPSIRPAPVTALHPTILQWRLPIASRSSTYTHTKTHEIGRFHALMCKWLNAPCQTCQPKTYTLAWSGMQLVDSKQTHALPCTHTATATHYRSSVRQETSVIVKDVHKQDFTGQGLHIT